MSTSTSREINGVTKKRSRDDESGQELLETSKKFAAVGSVVKSNPGISVVQNRVAPRIFGYPYQPISTPNTGLNYLVVIDCEATCDGEFGGGFRRGGMYLQEVIEIAAVVVNVKNQQILMCPGSEVPVSFQTYVQPTTQKLANLTKYCTDLTGITQQMVDTAPTFPAALGMFRQWLIDLTLMKPYESASSRRDWVMATDGSFDFNLFIHQGCVVNKIQYPEYAKHFAKIGEIFIQTLRLSRLQNIENMLASLGMSFEGKPHGALADAKNLARVACELLKRNADMRANALVIPEQRDPDWQRTFCCKYRLLTQVERDNFHGA